MVPSAKVVELLGGGTVLHEATADEDALEDAVRRGLPVAALRRLMSSGRLSPAEVTELILPRTTYGRREREGTLSEPESERVERLARVIAQAEEVFLDAERAARWLRVAHPELRDRRPLEVAASELGARRIETLLGQIAHGIPA